MTLERVGTLIAFATVMLGISPVNHDSQPNGHRLVRTRVTYLKDGVEFARNA